MAIAKPKSRAKPARSTLPRSSRWPWFFGSALIVLAVLGWSYREPIAGYTSAGAAYSAHVTCSCRYIGGRSLQSCEGDRISGMALISLSEDEEAKSITARFPLMPPQTATYREGYGCVLEKWED